jgi:hypothetical protein
VVSWNLNADGDFDNPANWDVQGTSPVQHRVPGAGDDAVISGTTSFTVTHAANVTDTVNTLSSNDHLVLSGGSITVANNSSAPAFDLNTGATFHVLANATMTIGDASHIAGTINVDPLGTFVFGGSHAQGIDLNTGTTLIGNGAFKTNTFAIIRINAPLTLPPTFDVDSGNDAVLTLNATVTAGKTFQLTGSAPSVGGTGTLVVPSGSTFDWEGGSLSGGNGILDRQQQDPERLYDQ